MVVRRKNSTKKRRKTSTKKRRNPSLPSVFEIKGNLDFDEIKLENGRYLVTIFYLGQPILREIIKSENGLKLLYSPEGKVRVAQTIQNVLRDRPISNPEEKEKEDKKPSKVGGSTEVGPVGLPKGDVNIWRMGYHAGLEDGMNMCGIFDYFKREEVRKQLQREFHGAFRDVTEQLKAQGGVVGYGRAVTGAKIPRTRGV